MSRPALGGRVTAYVNAGGSVGSVVKSLILGTPTPREARARNTAPTATASAPPRPRPRPRAAWTTLATPATSPTIPPSAKSPKPTIPRTIRSHASAGPITKSAPAITPKALRQPARDLTSSIAPPSLATRPDGLCAASRRARRGARSGGLQSSVSGPQERRPPLPGARRGDDLRPVVGGSIRLTLRVGTACARATMVRRTSHKDFVFP